MPKQPNKAINKRKPSESSSAIYHTYLLSLEVKNVLCFKEPQVLDLSDGKGNYAKWTVILGNNGVGKTTLLRCLAMLAKQEESGYPLPALMFILSDQNFSSISKNSLIWEELSTIHASPSKIKAKTLIRESSNTIDKHFSTQIDMNFGNPYTLDMSFENENETLLEILSQEDYKIFHEAKKNTEEYKKVNLRIYAKFLDNLLCYGYGATRKNGKEIQGEAIASKNSASLFSDDVTLMNAEAWLRETDYAFKSSTGETKNRLKKKFDHIIEILKRILPDIDDIRISPADKERPRPRAEFLTPYGWVKLSSLGLGYRTTIAWIVDLAVRLFERYPESEDPLAEPAIVLVDEIDLHMHPTWQRTIMKFLTERFPNTQFIVTAHSPLVVQAAQDANIVVLRREGDYVVIDNDPEIIENWRVDQVLTSVFEMPSARPAKIEPWLKRRQEILTKAKITQSERAELKELEAKIGTLPTAETSEDIRAMDILRRAAKLLDKSGTGAVE